MARDVLVRFRVSDDGTVALERVARAADGAERQLEQAGRAGGTAGDRIKRGGEEARSGWSQLTGSLQGVQTSIGGLFGPMTALTGIIGALGISRVVGWAVDAGRALVAFGGQALSTADQFRQLQTQLASLRGGDAAAAAADFAWIKDFAISTPMELGEVTQAFRSMLAYGIEPTAGGLQALTDAGYQYGAGAQDVEAIIRAVGQAWSKGKLQQEEALQLLERGIPVWRLLGDQLGMTEAELQKLATEGKLGRDAIQLLMDALARDTAGAAAERMNTLSGATSNLKDAWTQAMAEIGGAAEDPATLAVQQLGASIEMLRTSGAIEAVGQAFATAMATAAVSINVTREALDGLATAARDRSTWDQLYGMVGESRFSGQEEAAFAALPAVQSALQWAAALWDGAEAMRKRAGYMQAETEAAAEARAEEQRRKVEAETMARIQEGILRVHEGIAGASTAQAHASAERKRLAEEERDAKRDQKEQDELILGLNQMMGQEMSRLRQLEVQRYQDAAAYEQDYLAFYGQLDAKARQYEDEREAALAQYEADWRQFYDGLDQLAQAWAERWTTGLREMLSDAVALGFQGGFEDLGDLLDQLTEGWSQQLSQRMSQAFAEGGFSGMMREAQANPMQTMIGGASTVYQATQQQSRTAGALQGAMGGASAGLVFGWVGAIVGAVVGGLVGYLASGSDTPTTGASIGVGGADIFDTGGHQGYTEERRTRWEQSMNAVYLRQWQQYRGIAEMFGQADLLGLMGELPSWTTDVAGTSSRESMEVSAEELARILSDTILPAEFAETFRVVFRTGLERLGISDTMFGELESMLAGLPGQERMRYLQDYVGTVVGMSRLLVDLGTETVATRGGPQQMSNLTARAGQDPWDTFWTGFDQALGQVDVLTAGWDEMNLAMQIEQGTQVLALGETWYQNMLQYQTALIDMQDQMQAGIDSFRDRLTLRDMTDAEKGAWYQQEFQTALSSMRGATTPTGVQDAYNRAMQMLQGLEGLGGNGYSMPSWMLQGLLGQLEQQMQASMGGLQSEVETQAQALGQAVGEVLADLLGVGENAEGFQSVGGALADFSDAVDEITGGGKGDEGDLSQLGGKARETGDNLDRLGSAADRLAQALDAAAASAYSAASGTGGYSAALARLAYEITLAQTRGMSAATQSAAFA